MNALDSIRAAATEKAAAQAVLDERVEALNDLVRTALAEGATVADLADASGLSKPRIYQIRDRRR